MKHKYVVQDDMMTWFKLGHIYEGEPMIPSLHQNEAWLEIYKAEDGKKAYVQASFFMQIIERSEELGV